MRDRLTDRIAWESRKSSIMSCIDEIAGDLERINPRLALALDQVSDRLEMAAFDPKSVKNWSNIQELIIKTMGEVNSLHMKADPEGKKSGTKIFNLLSQAQQECKKQFKS